MKKFLVVSCMLLVISCSALATQPEINGGIRDGLAIGIMADTPVGQNVGLRFGVEANTGKQPIMLFFGGKFFLTNVSRSPLYLGLHGVGYTGSEEDTDVGFGISAIINRAFDIEPMFMEFGVDVADSARLLAQVGYKIY